MSLEDSETMAQFLFSSTCFSSDSHHDLGTEIPFLPWSEHGSGRASPYDMHLPSDANPNLYFWSPQSGAGGSSTGHCAPFSEAGSYESSDPNVMPAAFDGSGFWVGFGAAAEGDGEPMFFIDEAGNFDPEEDTSLSSPQHHLAPSGQRTPPNPKKGRLRPHEDDEESNLTGNSKKKSRSTFTNVQKNGKDGPYPKKSNSETETLSLVSQASGSFSSEDGSVAWQETSDVQADSSSKSSPKKPPNGKRRAGQGSASDPQSLYARRRRERINERLRVLQNLIPNGTKVDISTMLEEAVQYVKFLQLQIKLLSSPDMWMYAPIAYNGMDIGLDLNNISPP